MDRGGVLSRWLGQTVSDSRPAKQQLDLGHRSQDDRLVAEWVPDRPASRRLVGLTVISAVARAAGWSFSADHQTLTAVMSSMVIRLFHERRAGGDAGNDVVETGPSGVPLLRFWRYWSLQESL